MLFVPVYFFIVIPPLLSTTHLKSPYVNSSVAAFILICPIPLKPVSSAYAGTFIIPTVIVADNAIAIIFFIYILQSLIYKYHLYIFLSFLHTKFSQLLYHLSFVQKFKMHENCFICHINLQ